MIFANPKIGSGNDTEVAEFMRRWTPVNPHSTIHYGSLRNNNGAANNNGDANGANNNGNADNNGGANDMNGDINNGGANNNNADNDGGATDNRDNNDALNVANTNRELLRVNPARTRGARAARNLEQNNGNSAPRRSTRGKCAREVRAEAINRPRNNRARNRNRARTGADRAARNGGNRAARNGGNRAANVAPQLRAANVAPGPLNDVGEDADVGDDGGLIANGVANLDEMPENEQRMRG